MATQNVVNLEVKTMTNLSPIDKSLLTQIADMHSIPEGSYNIRKNGKCLDRKSYSDIEIIPKTDKSGIDIIVKPNVKNKSVHIPVIITETNLTDLVYNDFYIGENADVLIVAGCGIHNTGKQTSRHDGIHTFHLSKNSRVKYIEKHLGVGNAGDKVLNPITEIEMASGSYFEMETIQLGGVSSSVRTTNAKLYDGAKLSIKERILTTEKQSAVTNFNVDLLGKNSSVDVVSRSVAKDDSYQSFNSNIIGRNECFGHVECDGLLTGNAKISSTPKIDAENVNATLEHEAVIGKIAGDQLIKLLTLGLSKTEAENMIIKGFLK